MVAEGRHRLVAVGTLLAVAALMVGCGGQSAAIEGLTRPDNHGYHGVHVSPPYDVPQIRLTANTGTPYTVGSDDRTLEVVFFGYTNCPDVCQIVMGALTSAYLRLPQADRDRVRVVFVTTDPARDTERALTSYLARFDTSFLGLTGSLDRIDALAKPLGIFIKKGQQLPSGGYEVSHSTSVYVVSHGRAPLVWTGGTSPNDMAADLQRLISQEAKAS